ncbi:hypothetical protein FM036_22680 [Nostoc sp. HG1]|nr:hypothetical protein [Nostoc sp. HG1]
MGIGHWALGIGKRTWGQGERLVSSSHSPLVPLSPLPPLLPLLPFSPFPIPRLHQHQSYFFGKVSQN